MPAITAMSLWQRVLFVQGSSIELSADAPIEPPYSVYFQGGITWPHGKMGILKTLQNMIDGGFVELP